MKNISRFSILFLVLNFVGLSLPANANQEIMELYAQRIQEANSYNLYSVPGKLWRQDSKDGVENRKTTQKALRHTGHAAIAVLTTPLQVTVTPLNAARKFEINDKIKAFTLLYWAHMEVEGHVETNVLSSIRNDKKFTDNVKKLAFDEFKESHEKMMKEFLPEYLKPFDKADMARDLMTFLNDLKSEECKKGKRKNTLKSFKELDKEIKIHFSNIFNQEKKSSKSNSNNI